MGNPFCHIELSTGEVPASKAFYKKLFDWKLADMPMGPGMTYTMIDVTKGVGGGIQPKMMPEQPTAWMPYVEVADVKKSIAKAEKLGAKIVLPFQEIPGNGSMGIFIDPTGAALGVWAAAKKKAPAKKKPAKKSKR